MRIVFALPGSGDAPVGGFKVVYEYAGGLADRGHEVTVLHPACLPADASLWERSRGTARYVRRKWASAYGPRSWFTVHPRVHLAWTPSLHPHHAPDADAVVATSWETAEWVATYPREKGRKFYLIQHLETWSGPEARVLETWKLPLRKIVIARWLQEIATRLGQDAVYIPNGLNFDEFGMDVPPQERRPHGVLMMFHHLPWKGSATGLESVFRVKPEIPDLTLGLFGVPDRPAGLPAWVLYHRRPAPDALRRLYNEAAVFVAPSESEGWGLPAMEAMASGAALAGTDIGGHAEFAIHGETALLSPPGNADLLAVNVRRLLLDHAFRVRLAHQGRAAVQRFTWPLAVDRFETALNET